LFHKAFDQAGFTNAKVAQHADFSRNFTHIFSVPEC